MGEISFSQTFPKVVKDRVDLNVIFSAAPAQPQSALFLFQDFVQTRPPTPEAFPFDECLDRQTSCETSMPLMLCLAFS
jgi:hypothetical protein